MKHEHIIKILESVAVDLLEVVEDYKSQAIIKVYFEELIKNLEELNDNKM